MRQAAAAEAKERLEASFDEEIKPVPVRPGGEEKPRKKGSQQAAIVLLPTPSPDTSEDDPTGPPAISVRQEPEVPLMVPPARNIKNPNMTVYATVKPTPLPLPPAKEYPCLGIPVCNGHGSCNNGVCSCAEPWIGPVCATVPCPNNCTGHGFCNSTSGNCICDPGWQGAMCEAGVCPNDCNGNGKCVFSRGVCMCKEPWTGYDCAKPFCPHQCTGHGKCSREHGVCVCAVVTDGRKWRGVACDELPCPSNCSHHGTCDTSTGQCLCDKGYFGKDCSEVPPPPPPETLQPVASPTAKPCPGDCSAHGSCANGKCSCYEGWMGSACAKSNATMPHTPAPTALLPTVAPVMDIPGSTKLSMGLDSGSLLIRVESIVGFTIKDEIVIHAGETNEEVAIIARLPVLEPEKSAIKLIAGKKAKDFIIILQQPLSFAHAHLEPVVTRELKLDTVLPSPSPAPPKMPRIKTNVKQAVKVTPDKVDFLKLLVVAVLSLAGLGLVHMFVINYLGGKRGMDAVPYYTNTLHIPPKKVIRPGGPPQYSQPYYKE